MDNFDITVGRRHGSVSLLVLRERVERQSDDLLRTMQTDLEQCSTVTALKETSTLVKSNGRELCRLIDALHERYIKIGSISEAQEILNQKMETTISMRQFLNLINIKLRELGELSVSNIGSIDESVAGETGAHNLTSSGLVVGAGDLFATAQLEVSRGHRLDSHFPSVGGNLFPSSFSAFDVNSQARSSAFPVSTSTSFGSVLHAGTTLTGVAGDIHPALSSIPSSTIAAVTAVSSWNSHVPVSLVTSTTVQFTAPKCEEGPFGHGVSTRAPLGGVVGSSSSSLQGGVTYSNVHYRPVASPFAAPVTLSAAPGPGRCDSVPSSTPDPATLFLLRQELFKSPGEPFNGDPTKFKMWASLLYSRMKNIPLDALDKLSILALNTCGEPRKLIENYMAAGMDDPEKTFDRVWEMLSTRHGSPIQICASLKKKMDVFPPVRHPSLKEKLQELLLLCCSVEANMRGNCELGIFNLASGQQAVWTKFPESLQQGWRSFGHGYTTANLEHPPFCLLVEFLRRKVEEMCNPNFEIPVYDSPTSKRNDVVYDRTRRGISTLKTEQRSAAFSCIYHKSDGHQLMECKSFAELSYLERRKFARSLQLCFRCLGNHFASSCTSSVICDQCGGRHCPLMHNSESEESRISNSEHSRFPGSHFNDGKAEEAGGALSLCTSAPCVADIGRSCSKTLLAEVSHPSSEKRLFCYVIIDEQSNSSFVDSSIMDIFGISGLATSYSLTTMAGLKLRRDGFFIEGLRVRGVMESRVIELPKLLTSESIPDCRHEVAFPDIVREYPHISHLASCFPDIDNGAQVLLLLGRNCGDLMKTDCHGDHAPFAHHTPLGWALVGSADRGDLSDVGVLKTCHEHLSSSLCFPSQPRTITSATLFDESANDDAAAYSRSELRFLDTMRESICIGERGRITMPLPFKSNEIHLPFNKGAVFHRTRNTLDRLTKNTLKLSQCVVKMQESLNAGHVEQLSEEEARSGKAGRTWWLPVFPVSHPKKNKVRLVFDSSARFRDISLNDSLLSGPDDLNRLRGVLMRFRKGKVGYTADIESMFYNFGLLKEHRDFTRFFWFADNDPKKDLVQYRGCVHLFGNRPSPAVAHYGLGFVASHTHPKDPAIRNFILENFYVDDGLGCDSTVEGAYRVLSGTVEALRTFSIRLHKIASNSEELLKLFPSTELSDAFGLEGGPPHIEGVLGMSWDMGGDTLSVSSVLMDRPFTKRGMLSSVNSLFDPLGLVSPVTLGGKIIMRLTLSGQVGDSSSACGWDDDLPAEFLPKWEEWKSSIGELTQLNIERSYVPWENDIIGGTELHVFADASDVAIGAVAYLRTISSVSAVHVSFVMGSSRLIPRAATTIPRAELCAALEASHMCSEILRELSIKLCQVKLYSDSKVVLGYLSNSERRFSNYVANRVNSILKLTNIEDWQYISSSSNPADLATRPQSVHSLLGSVWLRGPEFLWKAEAVPLIADLGCVEELPEISRESIALAAEIGECSLVEKIFQTTSSWIKAIKIIKILLKYARRVDGIRQRAGVSLAARRLDVSSEEAVNFLVVGAQMEYFGGTFLRLKATKVDPQSTEDSIVSLDPFVDSSGVLRVGGRIKQSWLPFSQRHPIVLPYRHPISCCVVAYYHELSSHHGRHVTMGAVRRAGYHIHKGSKLIKDLLSRCVICRRLRALPMQQKMSDIPRFRMEENSPFTHSGIDVFGPFGVLVGRATRRNAGSRKMWALLLTCMVSRAVHVEALHGLDISSLKNALKRFTSVRGYCSHLYCDRGTNFVGAHNQDATIASLECLSRDNEKDNIQWHFNSPYASHHGGAWERKVGSVRRAMDFAFFNLRGRLPSLDEFCTFLYESSDIVNNTPLWEVSTDPTCPLPLCPAMLLTLREGFNTAPLGPLTAEDFASYGRLRWRRVRYMADCFWQEWRKTYLQGLQERRKWAKPKRNLKKGDLVLMRNKTSKRNLWPSAIVQEVRTSADGLVRSAAVRSADGKNFTRPVSELVLLLSEGGDH